MEKKLALIGIVVEDPSSIGQVNSLLHEYARFIVGRMGVPRHAYGVNVISVVIEAPTNDINALSGRLGRVDGITCKTIQTGKVIGETDD